MFTVDCVSSPSYFEDKSKDYAAKLKREQEAVVKSKATSCSSTPTTAPTTTSSSRATSPPQQPAQPSQGPSPQTLTQALLARQNKTRQAPPGFLGGVFQGFAKAASAPVSAVSTPVREKSLAEMEVLMAQKKRDQDKRDADIVSLNIARVKKIATNIIPSALCPRGKTFDLRFSHSSRLYDL